MTMRRDGSLSEWEVAIYNGWKLLGRMIQNDEGN